MHDRLCINQTPLVRILPNPCGRTSVCTRSASEILGRGPYRERGSHRIHRGCAVASMVRHVTSWQSGTMAHPMSRGHLQPLASRMLKEVHFRAMEAMFAMTGRDSRRGGSSRREFGAKAMLRIPRSFRRCSPRKNRYWSLGADRLPGNVRAATASDSLRLMRNSSRLARPCRIVGLEVGMSMMRHLPSCHAKRLRGALGSGIKCKRPSEVKTASTWPVRQLILARLAAPLPHPNTLDALAAALAGSNSGGEGGTPVHGCRRDDLPVWERCPSMAMAG